MSADTKKKGCKLHLMNRSIMDGIPSNIIFHIFSRLPARYLARCRCVSKVWCSYIDDRYLTIIHDKRVLEEPTPILYHQSRSCKRLTLSLCFHVIESKQTAGASESYVLEAKEGPFFEYFRKTRLSELFKVKIQVHGCCNGLICLSLNDGKVVVTPLAVVHPLRKECYELPPLRVRFHAVMLRDSCGFGFDASTSCFKMVCVLCKSISNYPGVVQKYLCTMVHEFGTNSWREIPQVPDYPIPGEGVFVNGCLHWLVSQVDVPTQDGGRPVIWFDLEKEEFGLIDPPKRMCNLLRDCGCGYDHLVDLNGEVGYVCTRTMEFWLLDYKKKEWVPHCRFAKEITPDGYIRVMGCWNKDGDILIKSANYGRYAFLVYNLKSGVLHKTNIAGREDAWSPNVIMYPNLLSSIHGINTNSTSMKKTILKKSCQRVLPFD